MVSRIVDLMIGQWPCIDQSLLSPFKSFKSIQSWPIYRCHIMKSQAMENAAEAPVNHVRTEAQKGDCVEMCGMKKYWFGVGVVLLIVLLSVGSSFLTKVSSLSCDHSI